MTTKRSVKLIKNEGRKEPETKADAESAADSNKWSKEVRSWVVETQQNRHVESLQAFESLFKDEPPEAEDVDLTVSIGDAYKKKNGETVGNPKDAE